jgi:hypothetical protein
MCRWCYLTILLFAFLLEAQAATYASIWSNGDHVQADTTEAPVQWFSHPSPNQYFRSLSAHMLDRGGAQYRMRHLFGHAGEIGITSHFSLAGGFDLSGPVLFRPGSPVIHLRPKFGMPVTGALNIFVSGLVMNIPNYGQLDRDSRLRVYEHLINGGVTLGSRDTHITLSGGVQLPHKEEAREIFELAGSWRPARLCSLMGEARSIPAMGRVDWIAGLRFHSRTWSVDMAIRYEADDFDRGFLPWVGLIVKP